MDAGGKLVDGVFSLVFFWLCSPIDLNNLGIEAEPEFQGSISNVTYPAGREAVLTCTVNNLGKYKVIILNDQLVNRIMVRIERQPHAIISKFFFFLSLLCCVDGNTPQVGWLRAADQTVLALQDRVVTHNARISVSHENYVTWRLRIKQLRDTDKGCYMCQINSSPMKKQIGCIDVQSKYRSFRMVLDEIEFSFFGICFLFFSCEFYLASSFINGICLE